MDRNIAIKHCSPDIERAIEDWFNFLAPRAISELFHCPLVLPLVLRAQAPNCPRLLLGFCGEQLLNL